MTVSQQQRQTQLFAAEAWQNIYQSFTSVNFASYDFTTIRSAMIDYIRLNYPEDFNDWIESQELVILIDLLSYLGTSLAFRNDLNTRENFMDTAQRRESIFRLARMLSYQPQRCIPATGLLKITQVVANQDIFDSNGTNLKNIVIQWNDQNNPDWWEQFILVLNASLDSNNVFGNPSKTGTVNGITTDIYQLNNTIIPTSTIPFTASVGGNNMNFELVNPTFSDATANMLGSTGYFSELDPDPMNAWNLIYQADGNGYGSANTGFFLMFKQGSIGYSDYKIDLPIANRVIDINVDNVNQTDVFVQTIDTSGLVTIKWKPVPSVNGYNVIYNSLNKNERNIFSVITRDSNGVDQISVRFADGNFGNVPTGYIRVWYRTSNGLSYQIRPNELNGLKFTFNYADQLNNTYSLAFTASLQYTVANAQTGETNDQIQLNASQVYYSQDRMVNAQDYNLYPLLSNQALKISGINRTYAGHSRNIDINDPTGSYQNTNIFSDDGILYAEQDQNQVVLSDITSQTSSTIVLNSILPIITGAGTHKAAAIELRDFYYANFPSLDISNLTWQTVVPGNSSCSGALLSGGLGSPAVAVGSQSGYPGTGVAVCAPGALIQFEDLSWAAIVSVVGSGAGLAKTGITSSGIGAITLNQNVVSGIKPSLVFAPWSTSFSTDEVTAIAAALDARSTFGIRYDYLTQTWRVISNANLSTSTTFDLTNAGNKNGSNSDASWLLKLTYSNNAWTVLIRSQRYIFESVADVRFYFSSGEKIIDVNTGLAKIDYINMLKINQDISNNSAGTLSSDYYWQIKDQEIYPDGYAESRAVRVTFWDSQQLGIPDNPFEYKQLVLNGTGQLLFWIRYLSTDGYQYYNPITITTNRQYQLPTQIPASTDPLWTEGEYAYVISTGAAYQYQSGSLVDVTSDLKVRRGRNNIIYQWRHWAPNDQRINPAIMNIIDMYVLTSSYDTALRNWISTNGAATSQPQVPTSEEIRSTFSYFDSFKMMTDTIIWHPVKYKLLFGSQADSAYQVKFLVVKAGGTTVSDNEVKSLVIAQINQYFQLSNWDFGQSFFFTELAAYIHINLATVVGSIVISPVNAQSKFGDLFEITCNPDEIFISCARVSDVQIVTGLTESTLGFTNA